MNLPVNTMINKVSFFTNSMHNSPSVKVYKNYLTVCILSIIFYWHKYFICTDNINKIKKLISTVVLIIRGDKYEIFFN